MLIQAPRAMACSCVQPDPVMMLAESDAAFIGTYEERDIELSADENPDWAVGYRFTVESWLSGTFTAPEIVVASADNGAGCGFEFQPGAHVAVFLYQEGDGAPSSGLCSSMDAELALSQLQTEGVAPDPGAIAPEEPVEVEPTPPDDGEMPEEETEPAPEPTASPEPVDPEEEGAAVLGGAPTVEEDSDTDSNAVPLMVGGAGVAFVAGLGFVLWRKQQLTA